MLVCGGRDYLDSNHVWSVLGELHAEYPISAIIEGGAFGADAWARNWGHSAGVPVLEYPAEWKKHGTAAGPIRNREMLKARPDLVVAFPGGRGTANMIKIATAAGIEVLWFNPPDLPGER